MDDTEAKWKKGVESVGKQIILTYDDTIEQQQWRLKPVTGGSLGNCYIAKLFGSGLNYSWSS
jgi:hypothetical protein